MNDKGLSILEQYDIKILSTRRGRGALICETEDGIMLLKEAVSSCKRIEMQSRLLEQIDTAGFKYVELFVKNREGQVVSRDKDETPYILKKWFEGKECDVRTEQEVLAATRNLAQLHKCMRLEDLTEEEKEITVSDDLIEEYEKHNRELRKVRNYIRNKRRKSEFEIKFMQCFPTFFEQAEHTLDSLKKSAYEDLKKESTEQGWICHGDYNHHNVLMLKSREGALRGIGTTNFERCHPGVQISDLYHFMRKIMEKQNWNQEMGRKMLDNYRSIRPVSNEEIYHLGVRLAYPEKFWKIGNHYFNSNKAWIPGKNIEKLDALFKQSTTRESFLGNIFV